MSPCPTEVRGTASPVDQGALSRALGGLAGWLESWRDADGAYNGFVVHRTEGKRMDRVHDTAWTQSAMIRGYGNLFRKSGEARWGDAMVKAADLLASRYDAATGRLRHTGHEDERFQSLVSCALGVCALLSIADLVDPERRERYVRLSEDHARRYWLDVLWVESEGAFKFTEVDYYSHHEDRFVVNFNTMAAEALLAIYEAGGDEEFRALAFRVGEWILARWEHAQACTARLLEGRVSVALDPASEWMAPGAFSYQFTASRRDPDNDVTLYAGLALRGLWALFQASGDARYEAIIRSQSGYILAMRDPETALFYHTAKGGIIEKNPQFIAGAGMTLLGLHEVQPLLGADAIPGETVAAILARAYPNGSYPGFIGKNDTGLPRRDGGGVVWEDVVASVNWNAQWFEYLTRVIDRPEAIPPAPRGRSVWRVSSRFVYVDSSRKAAILSWWPPRSWGLYCYVKRRPQALVSFYPVGLYSSVRAAMVRRRGGE